MKIGIDARFFGPSGKGLGRYTEKLVKNLEKIDRINQYVIFLRKENWDEFMPERLNFKKVLADIRWYTLQEQLFLPRILAREKLDLMHFPHFNVPVFYRGNFITTIHDLILLKFPTKRATTLGPLLYSIKYAGYKRTISRAVQLSKKIITVSNYTKNEIVDYFKINPQKIKVIYEAADSVESGQLALPNDVFLKQHKIIKPYLLYVGNAYPHKNLERLLTVFKKLKNSADFQYQLVLVGKDDYFYRRLKQNAQDLDLLKNNDVVFFGYATQTDLAMLYRQARLYVFPSYMEGFGLPPLEAMSHGAPVAVAQASCLPEILQDAAIYFDPKNEENMAAEIKKGLENDDLPRTTAANSVVRGLRQGLIRKGFLQVKKFSWQKMAEDTKKLYEECTKA